MYGIVITAEWSSLPAGAVGSPHSRNRLLIIAYRHEVGRRGFRFVHERRDGMEARYGSWETAPRGKWRDVVRWIKSLVETGGGIVPASERGGMVDGIPNRLDRIGGCGNAVVPQIAELIGRSIIENVRTMPQTS